MAKWNMKAIDSSITQCSRPFNASYKDLFDRCYEVEIEESDNPHLLGIELKSSLGAPGLSTSATPVSYSHKATTHPLNS